MKGKRGELDIRGQLAASTKDLNTSPTFSNKAIVILTTERKHTEKRSKKSKKKKPDNVKYHHFSSCQPQARNRK